MKDSMYNQRLMIIDILGIISPTDKSIKADTELAADSESLDDTDANNTG